MNKRIPGKFPQKRVVVIAGANGAGKTTFATEFLDKEAKCPNFINADLIAKGLSPFKPETVATQAGRLMLNQMQMHFSAGECFSFETTLSGLAYITKLKEWKASGYYIIIIFLRISSASLAIKRVKNRVRQGGHNVPKQDIIRRFQRGQENFSNHYKDLADLWLLYDNTSKKPKLIAKGHGNRAS